jgi:small conductance mechanosensitive channel
MTFEELQTYVAEQGLLYLQKIVLLLILLLIAKVIIAFALKAVDKVLERQKKLPELLKVFISGVAWKLLWILAILAGLETVGISVMPFIMGLGVAGFILGFAFQETLSNLAAGLMILIHSPFDKGHFVDAGGVTGSVTEINLASTVLTTPDNKKVVIPNSKVWGQVITNFSALPTRRVDMTFGVAYKSDLNKVREVINQVLAANGEKILKDPAPRIELMTMADSSLNFIVRPWVNTADYWDVWFKLNKEMKEAFEANGIEIPFPQRDMNIKGLPEAIAQALKPTT